MKVSVAIVLCISVLLIMSCAPTIPCADTDKYDNNKSLRASGEGSSSREDVAVEIAIVDAKQKLGEKVMKYAEDNFRDQTQVNDEAYNEKLRVAQKTVMQELAVTCQVVKKSKGRFYAYVTLDADVGLMETIIRSSKPESIE